MQLFLKRIFRRSTLVATPGIKLWRAGYLSLSLSIEYQLVRNRSARMGWAPPSEFGQVIEELPPGLPMPRPPEAPRVTAKSRAEAPVAPDSAPDPDHADFFERLGMELELAPPERNAGPPAMPRYFRIAVEDSWSWAGGADGPGETVEAGKRSRSIELRIWHPQAPYPGGAMVAALTHSGRIAGHTVTVTETSVFMGLPQHVLVTGFSLATPESQVQLYAHGIGLADFSAILESIQVHDNQIVAPDSLRPKPPGAI